MATITKLFCKKCEKEYNEIKFYTYRDGTKCELCKDCLTMHVNAYEPETFKWILKQFDMPYIPAEWKRLREKDYEKEYAKAQAAGNPDPQNYAYNKTKGNGAIVGKYISKMKLKQWAGYRWEDTEMLVREEEEKARLYGTAAAETNVIESAFQNGEITEAQYLTYKTVNPDTENQKTLENRFLEHQKELDEAKAMATPVFASNESIYAKVDLPDPAADLTQDDKIYLALKWGKLYTPTDWIWLEQKYDNFMSSFDIQGEARIDTLIFICKTSLKMNLALDSGDIDTYQKLAKVYDAQMKAAKFTEAQRKEEGHGDFDSVGAIVAFAEKEGGKIERYKITYPLDKVDEAIKHLKDYAKDLIMSDVGLARRFENMIDNIEANAQQKKDKELAKEMGVDVIPLSNEDMIEFSNKINEQKDKDIETMKEESDSVGS